MHALKERVSERLSRLFTDSPTSSSVASASPNPQVRPYSKEEKSISSYFSFINPSSIFDGSKSHNHHNNVKQSPSFPSGGNYGWQLLDTDEECPPKIGNKETLNASKEDKASSDVTTVNEIKEMRNQQDVECAAVQSSCPSDVEVAIGQRTPKNPLANLKDDSVFISAELYEFLHSSLPNIVKGCQWVLLYSTVKHGISLRTLIRKSADLSGPCLLIAGDTKGAVFGGMLECPIKPTPKRKYQGTNQTFVFTTIYGEPRLFRPTGVNRYYYLCLNDLLALGGGGNFALCLDGDLLRGTSGPCETFGNSCLAVDTEFQLKNVELWGFTHASQYLT